MEPPTNEELIGLSEVSSRLGVKKHRIDYALSNGLLPEPSIRVSGHRAFAPDDVRLIAAHFGVCLPDPPVGSPVSSAAPTPARTSEPKAGVGEPDYPLVDRPQLSRHAPPPPFRNRKKSL